MATVYDKSSLFLAPSGVNDGTVFVQKPVPMYGPEVVTNGDFATDSDWTKQASWSISGGVATYDKLSSGQELRQLMSDIAVGKTIEVKFDILNIEATKRAYFKLDCSGTPESIFPYTLFSEGTYIYRHTITGGFNRLTFTALNSGNGGSFSIDNVSVKEVSGISDFDFSRGSNLSATRVNADGLIEKGRENLILQSNAFSTSPWLQTDGTATSGQSGYDGTNNAWLINKSGANGRIRQLVAATGVVTTSVYAKAGTNNWLRISFAKFAFFDLANGVIGNTNAIDTTITSVGNGWYRCTMTANSTSTQFANYYPAEDDNVISGTSGNILMQSIQMEIGLAATGYIPTTAATGKAGILENTPRLDYSGGATCPSLLLEPSRTQLIKYSEYFGGWNSGTFTPIISGITSPQGVNNAYTLPFTNSAGSNIYTFATLSSTNEHIFSIYAKVGSGTKTFRVRAEYGGTSVTSSDFTATTTWQRFEFAFTPTATNIVAYIFNGSNGEQSNLEVWGAQCEQGSYPTSYIPNHSGGSVTRGGDNCFTNNNSLLEQTSATYFLETTPIGILSNNLIEVRGNGSTSNRVVLQTNANGSIRVLVRTQGSSILDQNVASAVSQNTKVKVALKYTPSNISFFVDGVKKIDTDLSVDFSPELNGLDLEGSVTANDDALKQHQFLFFPEALSDTDCEILTGATTYETFEEMALALNYTVYE